MTSREIKIAIISSITTILTGCIVWLFTSYFTAVAELSAIKSASKQLDVLTNQVIDVRVQAKLSNESLIESKKSIEDQLKSIEEIHQQITKRQSSIEQIDIISALDGKIDEFNKLATEIVKANLSSELEKLLDVKHSQVKWSSITEKELKEFNVSCEYRFLLGSDNVIYFDRIHTGTLSVETSNGHYSTARWNTQKLSLMTQVGNNHYTESRFHAGQLQSRCET